MQKERLSLKDLLCSDGRRDMGGELFWINRGNGCLPDPTFFEATANRQHSSSFYHIGFPERKKMSLFVCLMIEINAQSVVHLSVSQMQQKYQQVFF